MNELGLSLNRAISFYGIMDLTGNGHERLVPAPTSATDSNAIAFTGEHGDGLVSTLTTGWPGSGFLVSRGGGCLYRSSSSIFGGPITPVSVAGSIPVQGLFGAIPGVRTAP